MYNPFFIFNPFNIYRMYLNIRYFYGFYIAYQFMIWFFGSFCNVYTFIHDITFRKDEIKLLENKKN
jgi:hypothetical protein